MMRTVRFLTGLSMVVAGVSLAAPMATRLVESYGDSSAPLPGAVGRPDNASAAAWAGAPAAGNAPGSGAGGFCIPDVKAVPVPLPPAIEYPTPMTADQGREPAGGGALPPVPAALPSPPADLSLAPPPVGAMYRSTLDAPPPPLLDATIPAPLAVSTVRERDASSIGGVRLVSAETALPPEQSASLLPTSAPNLVPSIHVVRDGDDLTSIATAIYGHPGAAEAIWNANRDRLSDPGVLPIGMTLRIPSSWVPPAARAMGAGGADLIEPGQRPARVRVAPGETFESLAVRFYGDRAWASRLWDANRDLVRSPALLVAGIELRLP